ncbi:MAG TPA: hypothetical protein VF884_06750 [Nitrososphaeraceae archaeon]
MPYLDSKIEKHKPKCSNPVGKRLYIRDYDDKGKQQFAPWGLTCTTCGVVVKQKYQQNLTAEQRRKKEHYDKELYEHMEQRKIRDKLKRLLRRRMGPDPITPKESGLRRRIEGYNRLYSYPDKLANLIKWNPELPVKFLNMEPRATLEQLTQIIESSPLGRYNNGSDIFRTRNLAPDSDKPGYLKYDTSHWRPDPDNPGKMKYNQDKDFVNDHDKAIIEEAQTRRKIMEEILKARGIKIVDLLWKNQKIIRPMMNC